MYTLEKVLNSGFILMDLPPRANTNNLYYNGYAHYEMIKYKIHLCVLIDNKWYAFRYKDKKKAQEIDNRYDLGILHNY